VRGMRFGVLGPIVAWTDEGRPVPIPGAKVRALLADLVVHVGQPVTADRLVDDLWGESPDSSNPAGMLSSKVSQLRRALDVAEPGARALVVSPPPGYTLAVDPAAVDAVEFTSAVDEGATCVDADPARAVELVTGALALWRGPAYGAVADLGFARAAAGRLDEQRVTAHEVLARARLALGEHARVADDLTALVDAHPWREDLRLSHVRALYRAGRQPDALASFERYRGHLVDELGIDPSPEALALQHAVLVQDPALDAPTRPQGSGPPVDGAPFDAAADRHRHRPPANLPALRGDLIGRDADAADLVDALGAERLVTLVGPGGVGKTSLALAAAHRLTGDLPDGAWFVDLAGIERGGAAVTPDVLADLVTATLAMRQAPDDPASASSASSVDRLAAALRDHDTLVVLDNCEHVVDAAAEVVDRLTRGAPGVTVLATSREALGVAAEVVRTVAPLAVPDPRDQGQADVVARAESVRLFVARARAAGATLEIEGRNAPLLGTLCRRLDGLPLALELAATRVPALGLPEVVARLGDRFRLLGSGRRGGPDRHRTLEAMLDWSWELLGDDERRVLRRMAVHVDGCTVAAATAVGDDGGPLSPGVVLDPAAQAATADVVARLVRQSLVVADHGPAGARYRLLESVAAYAAARLVEVGERERVRGRHLTWHVALAEQADGALRGPDQAVWLAALDVESANMQAALDTAVELARADEAHRLVAALGWYWTLRGRTALAARALDSALALAPPTPSTAWARAVTFGVAAALTRGDVTDHAERCAHALAAFDPLDVPVERGRAALLLGGSLTQVGLVTEGEALLDDAARVAVAQGDRWGEAAALVGLALPAHMRSDLDRLEQLVDRADALFTEVGDGWGRLAAGEWLGALAELRGDLDAAEKLLEVGLPDAERLGLWQSVASRLGLLGLVAHQREDWPAARLLGEQARRLALEQADRSLEVLAGMVLGFTARRTGDLDEAEVHLRALLAGSAVDPDTLAAAPGAGDSGPDGAGAPAVEMAPHVATTLAELGFVAELRGDPARALALHAQVVDAALASGYRRDVAGGLEGMAAALSAQGDAAAAARLLGAAATVRADAELAASGAEQRDIARAHERAVAVLGAGEVDRLMAEGRALRPDEAVAGAAALP
jgi:predicted ATPase/DNA-binding SARP family transcriptional activator